MSISNLIIHGQYLKVVTEYSAVDAIDISNISYCQFVNSNASVSKDTCGSNFFSLGCPCVYSLKVSCTTLVHYACTSFWAESMKQWLDKQFSEIQGIGRTKHLLSTFAVLHIPGIPHHHYLFNHCFNNEVFTSKICTHVVYYSVECIWS